MANVGTGTPQDPDHGWYLYIVSVILVILSGIFVVIRVAIRLAKKMMGVDDYIIIFVCPKNHSFDRKTNIPTRVSYVTLLMSSIHPLNQCVANL